MEFPIDLVVTDVVMPMMGGDDLAAFVRAAQPGMKILFMSGGRYAWFRK
jgi:YesN/AraC family two-component response regulator